jgi:S1-C subfamily serine protease
MIAQTPVGAEKTLTLYRGGATRNLKVVIGEQPKVKPDEYETKYGFTVKEITDDLYRTHLLQARDGVYVSFVDVGTVADKGNLAEGDVIMSVDKKRTPDFKTFKSTMEASEKESYILLSVLRGKDRRLALLDKTDAGDDQAIDTLNRQ